MEPTTLSEQLWLVKSSDRILGPFTTQELSERILSKEIVLIDEVASPRSRWKHIRDEPTFASVVAEVRSKQLATKDDTEVGTGTPTISAHVDSEDGIPTQVISAPIEFEQEGQLISETASSKARIDSTIPAASRSRNSSIHDSLSYSPQYSSSRARRSQIFFVGVGVAALSVALILVFKPDWVQRLIGARQDELKQIQIMADRAYDLGDFSTATRSYERVLRDSTKNTELELRYATLVLRSDRDVLNAKRRIETLLPKLLTPELKARGQVALAVAKLQNDEALEARQILDEVVKSASGGPIAYFNLAAAQMLTGQLESAASALELLDGHASLGTPAMLLKALAFARQGSPKLALQQLGLGQGAGPGGLVKLASWKQEALALAAVFELGSGGTTQQQSQSIKRVGDLIRLAIDCDPYQTDEFFSDPLLYLEPLQWRRWLDLVEDLFLKLKGPQSRALYALSLMKSGQVRQGMAVLKEYTSGRTTVEPEVQAVMAYGHILSGQIPEARAVLKLAQTAAGPLVVSTTLEGRICQEVGDVNCAEMAWARLAGLPNAPIIAQVGQVRMERKEQPQAGVAAIERLKMLYPDSLLVRELLFEASRGAM